MKKIHLIHGFNVFDGGKGSIGSLQKYFEDAGHEVELHNYGWVGILRLRLVNKKTVRNIMDKIDPDKDVVIGHSNGCLVAWMIAAEGVIIDKLVCIQPALRRDTIFPHTVRNILTLYNKKDVAVFAARIFRYMNPVSWFHPHQWGMAGKRGFTRKDTRMKQINTLTDLPVKCSGHTYLGKEPETGCVAKTILEWIKTLEQEGK